MINSVRFKEEFSQQQDTFNGKAGDDPPISSKWDSPNSKGAQSCGSESMECHCVGTVYFYYAIVDVYDVEQHWLIKTKTHI